MGRPVLVGAVTGIGVTLGLRLLHGAGVGYLPVVDDLILRPGELATWLFVLGDVGTPAQYIVWPLVLSCALNAAVGAGLGWLAGTVWYTLRGEEAAR